MATVKELIDALAAGRVNVDRVADDFRSRRWPALRLTATDAQAYGVVDDIPDDDPNSWARVQEHPDITDDQYEKLYAAWQQSSRRTART